MESSLNGIVQNTQHGLMESAANVFGSLIIVLGILLIALYVSKNYLKREYAFARGSAVRVLGSTPLGMKKSVSLVKIPGAVLVLGVSQDTVTLLSKIENNEVIAMLSSEDEKTSGNSAARNFRVHAQRPSEQRRASDSGQVFSTVTAKILDFTKFKRFRPRAVQLHPVPIGEDTHD